MVVVSSSYFFASTREGSLNNASCPVHKTRREKEIWPDTLGSYLPTNYGQLCLVQNRQTDRQTDRQIDRQTDNKITNCTILMTVIIVVGSLYENRSMFRTHMFTLMLHYVCHEPKKQKKLQNITINIETYFSIFRHFQFQKSICWDGKRALSWHIR